MITHQIIVELQRLFYRCEDEELLAIEQMIGNEIERRIKQLKEQLKLLEEEDEQHESNH